MSRDGNIFPFSPAEAAVPPPLVHDGDAERAATRFKAVRDVLAEPVSATVVDGLAWVGCLTVFVGESGAGKTFVLLDLAAALSAGRAWHGRPVQRGSVAYCSFEGDALARRLRALLTVGEPLEHVYVLTAREPISPVASRDGIETPSAGEVALVADLEGLVAVLTADGRPPVRLLVVDTVRASLVGSEDQSENASAYLRAVRRIGTHVPDAAVILVHHAGWQDGEGAKKRERGSSAWRGNGDCTVYLEAVGGNPAGDVELSLTTLKARDDVRQPPLRFIRRTVRLSGDVDTFGRPATSCIMLADERTAEEHAAAKADAKAARERPVDLRILRAIRDRSITAKTQLRGAVGLKRDDVLQALDRLLSAGLVLAPERERQPYRLSHDGSSPLLDADRTNRPESSRVIPTESSRVDESSPLTGDESLDGPGGVSDPTSRAPIDAG